MNGDFRLADFGGGGSAKENVNRDDLAISRKMVNGGWSRQP